MFAHNKRLQYTVRVQETNPGLANLLLEQFGGPQGELAAACRYFTQALSEEDGGRKDMLMDIATEELSHLEVIGTLVATLNRGAKGRIAEGLNEEAELYRSIQGAGNDSHVTQMLYGGGAPLVNSGAVPWSAAYVDTIGDPSADLRSNIAAEARAKIIYERLIQATDDPGVREALGFLMTREMAHQLSFEKALYAMQPNFPPGKLPGDPRFARVYFNTSQGQEDVRGSWNSDENFEYVSGLDRMLAVDGGAGDVEASMKPEDQARIAQMAARTQSDRDIDPMTGAELGMGQDEQDEGAAAAGDGAGLSATHAKVDRDRPRHTP